jgi:hypothetical protein
VSKFCLGLKIRRKKQYLMLKYLKILPDFWQNFMNLCSFRDDRKHSNTEIENPDKRVKQHGTAARKRREQLHTKNPTMLQG